jgi:hypothetical protein
MFTRDKGCYIIKRKNDVNMVKYIPWFTYFNEQHEKEQHFKRKIKKYSIPFSLTLLFLLALTI